jgi:hypothetical protein
MSVWRVLGGSICYIFVIWVEKWSSAAALSVGPEMHELAAEFKTGTGTKTSTAQSVSLVQD